MSLRSVRCAVSLVLPVLLLAACQRDAAPADAAAFSRVDAWTLPVQGEAAHPDLTTTPAGDLLLSWVEPAGDGRHALALSTSAPRIEAGASPWTPRMQVAAGDDWFLNWADTPHVYALEDGSLWAHWLRSTGPARMDYGIDLVRSTDGGATWSAPQMVNLERSRGDHGFVTFWRQGASQLGMAWLDSRQRAALAARTANSEQPGAGHDAHAHSAADGHDAHHGHGRDAMMLRAAIHDGQGVKRQEWPLDDSTCDCCTTSSAMTDRGVVVVYRGRSSTEVRDTRLVRLEGDAWTAPRDVHADGWLIAGCPVNGPVVAAEGNTVWVAWYTEADGVPELRAARSDDAGDTFAAPVTVAKGGPVLGRASIALADDHVLVSWLEEAPDQSQRMLLGRYDRALGNARRIEAGTLAARGRASGMPRLAVAGDAAWLVWTDVHDGAPVLRGVRAH